MLDELTELIKTRVVLWFKAVSGGCFYSVHELMTNLQQVRKCLS